MEFFGKEEIEFNLKCLERGVRLDNRGFETQRIIQITRIDYPMSDSSISIRCGNSLVEMNLVFQLSEKGTNFFTNSEWINGKHINNTHLTVDPEEEIQDENLDSLFQIELKHPNPVLEIIETFLKQYNVGANVEINILKNDGNVFDMIFGGLKYLFNEISIPDISNLSKDIKGQLELPHSQTFVITPFGILVDPTMIEESSAGGIIHVFILNGTRVGVLIEKTVKLDDIEEIIKKIDSMI